MKHKILKNIINKENHTLKHTNIMQIASRDLTAPLNLKNFLRKMGTPFSKS